MNKLTVNQAAKKLKVTPGRVRHFIDEGRLAADWDDLARRYFIPESALSSFQRIKRTNGKHRDKKGK